MYLIDTHAHIYLPEFRETLPEHIRRAEAARVHKILMPAIDRSTHNAMLAVEAQFGGCLSMMGVHPCSVKEDYEAELAEAEGWLKQRSFIAVGEIGLDFYWDTTFKKEQYDAFHRQIGWALQYDLPIVIHSRNATDECIEVVRQYPGLKGVFHCFSGTVEQAQQVMETGFLLGIGGVVTFKNGGLDKVLLEVGISSVVLETDAPYLAPVPFRGKRNESSYLAYVLDRICSITGLPNEEVATLTTENANKLFKIS